MKTNEPILIVGYGKMGKTVKKLSEHENPSITIDKDCDVAADYPSLKTFLSSTFNKDDFLIQPVAIDFSQPDEVLRNIDLYARYNINAVIGTTGWYADFAKVDRLIKESGIGLVYSANFSDSVQMAFVVNRAIAAMADLMGDWDVAINEAHHNAKKDPSGTARTFAHGIINHQLMGKKEMAYELNNNGKPETTIQMSSERLMGIFGEHTIRYAHTSGDQVTLFHHANSREGFASGALKAAEFIRGKSGIYDYSDIVRERYIGAIVKEFGISR